MYKSKTKSGVEFTVDIIKTEKEFGRTHSLEIVFVYDSSNERTIWRRVLHGTFWGFLERAEQDARKAVEYYSNWYTENVMNDLTAHIPEELYDTDYEQIKLMVHKYHTDLFNKIRLSKGIKLGREKRG